MEGALFYSIIFRNIQCTPSPPAEVKAAENGIHRKLIKSSRINNKHCTLHCPYRTEPNSGYVSIDRPYNGDHFILDNSRQRIITMKMIIEIFSLYTPRVLNHQAMKHITE